MSKIKIGHHALAWGIFMALASMPMTAFAADESAQQVPDGSTTQKAPDGSDFHGIFPYPSSSPFGAQGAYVYGKVAYRW